MRHSLHTIHDLRFDTERNPQAYPPTAAMACSATFYAPASPN